MYISIFRPKNKTENDIIIIIIKKTQDLKKMPKVKGETVKGIVGFHYQARKMTHLMFKQEMMKN